MTTHLDSGFSLNEETTFFQQNGYIGPITIYSPEEMARMCKIIRRDTLDRSYAAYPEDVLSGGTNIANYDRHLDVDLLAQHVCNQRIVDRVASILGPGILCWRTEFLPKYPGDEGTDRHQADTFANASGKPQILWPGETEDNFTASSKSTRIGGRMKRTSSARDRERLSPGSGLRFPRRFAVVRARAIAGAGRSHRRDHVPGDAQFLRC